ncbi:aldehyde dehydrogenase (NADP(+)) [Erythrobacter litoralis]|uniref:aldehyde dehydrogenase (NADP(+)) n=1 Tax=Erythrobacter litoralis TaxID=39960 RepID=UPI00243541A5|nr:aldehyde dehydrogenase (NADP(+)) [Erythrobacter litoralis]MDG6079265.1 aldehyde dehydrogenase (NADP(+)) [Erythrobacter litoralis]
MLTGTNLIAGEQRQSGQTFQAVEAASGTKLDPAFHEASEQDVADACAAAAEAQKVFGALSPAKRAAFIRLVAEKIDALGDMLTQRAMQESGLPEARLNGERGRTVGQLRLFADEVEQGEWQRLRIDHADGGKTPSKPDLRLRMIPLGPVAVFGASNFPLAFSVAGGDTASAFAAGCCVVVKGHPAHPGTSELVAGAIREAVSESGLPAGVFSLVNSTSNAIGEALVTDPRIAAVGFTGSRAGGLALMRHAAERPVPIPVYAEMSSINPVVLMPNKLAADAEALGQAYVGSLSLGAGQFCTNPGIVLGVESDALDTFVRTSGKALESVAAQTMLTSAIRGSYDEGIGKLGKLKGVELVGTGAEGSGNCGRAQVFTVSGDDFLGDDTFSHEVFGPSSVVVRCRDLDQVREILTKLKGQLTTTLHMNEADHDAARELLPVMEQLAGRIIANAWPTGVDVTHAMVHGGPFPATSDGRSTSVGTLAIDRFLRPVSYQDMPSDLLPEALREDGGSAPRRVDGQRAG